jgi:pyruvate, orthophosphate dikinase
MAGWAELFEFMNAKPLDLHRFVNGLAARAKSPSTRFFIEDLLGDIDASTATGGERALELLRAAALRLACWDGARAEKEPLLQEMLDHFGTHPLRTWKEVLWALDLAAACPGAAGRLLRTLMVNLRLTSRGEIGVLGNLAVLGDATHDLLPLIRRSLAALLPLRGSLDWTLLRQLAKSLPKVGGAPDEIHEVRGIAEEIQWRLDCPLTLDIREEVHSRASPANLTLVRAYLAFLESGDLKKLGRLRLSQKIPAHDRSLALASDPTALKEKLVRLVRDLERHLARIYAFDPEDEGAVQANVRYWLDECALDGKIRRQVERILSPTDAGGRQENARCLVQVRTELGGRLEGPEAGAALDVLYLDLELEKLGYLLFGQMVHDDLEVVDSASLPRAVDLLRTMLLSSELKGQGSDRLHRICQALLDLPQDGELLGPELFILNGLINDGIGRISLDLYRAYETVVRELLEHSVAPEIEITVNRFVDGLVRDTTLHHLGELALKIYLLTQVKPGQGPIAPQDTRDIHVEVDRFYDQFADQVDALIAARGPQRAADRPLVCRFGPGEIPARAQASLLGGKAAGLCAMSALGLEVPPGFVLTLETWERFRSGGGVDTETLQLLRGELAWLEDRTGLRLGDPERPLLVAVRSGAALSMPGMMDTVLNVGMDEKVALAWAARHGEAFACGIYGQFLSDFAGAVLGLSGVEPPERPCWDDVHQMQRQLVQQGAEPFWQKTEGQLEAAVAAVFGSWDNQRAAIFRDEMGLSGAVGTAVTVQRMVFGNADAQSCTGVVFTRDPTTGEDRLYGEYLPGAQGHDLVDGRRTPLPLLHRSDCPGQSFAECYPTVFARLRRVAAHLEEHYRDMQDIEFTVESGVLYLLQTRSGRRTTEAANRIAGDLTGAVAASQIQEPVEEIPCRVMACGLGASPGRVIGRIALSCTAAVEMAERGERVVLVRPRTAPDDLPGMVAAVAVLTQHGGTTSHAANNARYMGKPCVVGCPDLEMDQDTGSVRLGAEALKEGDELVIDGGSGEVGLPC